MTHYKPSYGIRWKRFRPDLLGSAIAFLLGSALTFAATGYYYARSQKVFESNEYPVTVTPAEDAIAPPDALGEAYDPLQLQSTSRITCYKPPTFPLEDVTASGLTIASALMLATSLKCDGICAVSPDFHEMSARIRTGSYAQVMVKDGTAQGLYLVVDRTASRLSNTIDVWTDRPDQWCYWSEYIYINPLVEATK